MKRFLIVFLSVVSFVIITQSQSPVEAHPGRTDRYGGHHDYIHGGYHYHNGGGSDSDGSSNNSSHKRTRPAYPSSVRVKKPTTKTYAGSSVKISYSLSPSNAENTSVAWFSSNQEVATVSDDGTIEAIGVGTTTITVKTANGIIDSVELSILPTEAESISITDPPSEIAVGAKAQLSSDILPKSTTDRTIAWESSDSAVLAVDSSGNIEALAVGSAVISATTSNGKKAECTITTYEIYVQSIRLEVSRSEVNVDDEVDITVLFYPENASFKDYTISYSNPDAVETVTDNSIRLINQGKLTITAKSRNGKQASAEVDIILPVSDIALKKEEIELFETQTLAVDYEILPADATIQDLDWEHPDDGMLSIDSSGNITALKEGETTVKAISHNGIEKSFDVRIKPYYVKWLLDNMPFLIIGALAVGGGIVFAVRKKRGLALKDRELDH